MGEVRADSAAAKIEASNWSRILARYRRPSAGRSFVEILITFAPFVLLSTPLSVVPALLPILAVSGAAEIGYIVALTKAYEHGDLSLVYPLARGSAPFFVTLWSVLIIGERLPLSVKMSWVIVREDGDWKIVNHHASSRTPRRCSIAWR